MLICRQYSTSLERRGIWEAFHHWLETRDFLKSEFKTRTKKTPHMMGLCAYRFPEESNWQAAGGEEKEWPVPHLQWPALAHAVGTGGCAFLCVFWSGSFLLSHLYFMVKDVPLTGRSQAGFHVWLERERQKREGSRKERGRKRETRWKGCPCWTETDVGDWWGSEQHWHTNCAATYNIIPSQLFCSHGLDNMCWCRTTAVQHMFLYENVRIVTVKYYNNFSLSICPIPHNQGGKQSVL